MQLILITCGICLLLLGERGFAHRGYWYDWRGGGVNEWDLCRSVSVILVGRVVEASVAKGVRVYSQGTSVMSGVRIVRIQVEEVLLTFA